MFSHFCIWAKRFRIGILFTVLLLITSVLDSVAFYAHVCIKQLFLCPAMHTCAHIYQTLSYRPSSRIKAGGLIASARDLYRRHCSCSWRLTLDRLAGAPREPTYQCRSTRAYSAASTANGLYPQCPCTKLASATDAHDRSGSDIGRRSIL